MRYQAPRGTHDVLPQDVHLWQWLEETFRRVANQYGYREIRTPMFEDVEVFIRSSGETSDVVSKEMYDFEDKGGRHIALKPENTAPSVRAYLEHHLGQQGQTTRLYYISPIFRYGRPQKGRLRQHHQCGLELLGSGSAAADAEIIESTVRFYEALGLRDLNVLLNSIGKADCRTRYREVVLSHFAQYLSEQAEEFREKAQKNPLRMLDLKDPDAQEITKSVPSILDYLEPESMERFIELRGLLESADVAYTIDPGIVRGLDYYTETVFEVQSTSLGAQSSLCGGGRYDNLVEDLGGSPTPAVGVGIGIERALLVLEDLGKSPVADLFDAYVVAATDNARAPVAELARELRQMGKSALYDLDSKSMKSQLKDADRLACKLAILIGDDEISGGYVTVREMLNSEQKQIQRDDLFSHL